VRNQFFGKPILWKAVPDGSYQGDGGWDSQLMTIDNTKLYRFSIWIKKTGSTDGTTYFGSGSSTGSLVTLAGSSDSNPYFWWGDLPELNKWYLLVGYIHPHNDPSTTNYGGVYDGTTGAKVASTSDYKFNSSQTNAQHRTYLYYDYTTSDRQYFYGPEMYAMSDNTPLVETAGSAYFNGNAFFGSRVGIGTTTPQTNLEVVGAGQIIRNASGTDYTALRLYNNQNNIMRALEVDYSGSSYSGALVTGGPTGESASITTTGAYPLVLGTANTARLFVSNTGKIGIGTISPDQQLTVKGKIHAEEVIIDLSVPAPDYVFENDYSLTPLDTLKAYLAQHKHLPEVPSAKEMETNGVKVGEMEMILLKKIEELTLHLIEKNIQLNELEKRIEGLEHTRNKKH
jgi:hypothetical protein